MSHMCTFHIGHLAIFIIVTTVVQTKQLVTRTKRSMYTFVTLLKYCLPQIGLMTFLHQVIASPSDVRYVATNLPFLIN